MRSVCSLLAQQFLTGVSDICRSSVDDDVSPLELYLLHAGRGAMLLKVINTLGVEVCILVYGHLNYYVSNFYM